jgi:hypothetical protein
MRALAALAALSACTLLACASTTAPVTSPPVAISAPTITAEQNPDVIWIVRSVQVRAGEETRTRSGSFACYRKPLASPGPPTCFLSNQVWDPRDLSWPGPMSLSREGMAVVGAQVPPASATHGCVASGECGIGYGCAFDSGAKIGRCAPTSGP